MVAHRRMQAQRVDAGRDEQPAVGAGVVQRRHAKLVARAQKALTVGVPEHEREVTRHTLQEALVPCRVGVQDELGVGACRRDSCAGRPQRHDEVPPRIEADVGAQPYAAVEGQRLARLRGAGS